MYLENNKKLYENLIIKFVLFMAIVFNSGHALQTIIPSLKMFVFLVAAIVCIPAINQLTGKTINVYNGALLLFVVMVFSSTIVHLGAGWYTNFSFLVVIVVAFGITYIYSFEKFVNVYISCMTFVTVVALIGYFLVNNTAILETLPTMININDIEYKVGVIYNYITEIPDRNCGMFWEPGLFATHLTYALVFEIVFKEKKINWFRILIFSVAIITANSSAGFVLLILSLGLIFVKDRGNNKVKVFWQLFAGIVIVLLIVLFLNMDTIISNSSLAKNEYVAKLLSENVEDQSRVKALGHNMQQFLRSPLFGIGFSDAARNIKYVADTSTSTYLLSVFGVLGAFYTIFLVYGVLKYKKANFLTKILVISIFISIINKEPHQNILFTWMIIFYLLKNAHEYSFLKKEV